MDRSTSGDRLKMIGRCVVVLRSELLCLCVAIALAGRRIRTRRMVLRALARLAKRRAPGHLLRGRYPQRPFSRRRRDRCDIRVHAIAAGAGHSEILDDCTVGVEGAAPLDRCGMRYGLDPKAIPISMHEDWVVCKLQFEGSIAATTRVDLLSGMRLAAPRDARDDWSKEAAPPHPLIFSSVRPP